MKKVFVIGATVAGFVHVDPAFVAHVSDIKGPEGSISVDVADSVVANEGDSATQNPDGSWTFAPQPYGLLDPDDVYLAFKTEERIAIKASADPAAVEFWATYEMLERSKKPFNMNRASIQGALQRFKTLGYLASDDRIVEISKGIPQ